MNFTQKMQHNENSCFYCLNVGYISLSMKFIVLTHDQQSHLYQTQQRNKIVFKLFRITYIVEM